MAVFSFKFKMHHCGDKRDPYGWTLTASGHGEDSIDEVMARLLDFKAQYLKELDELGKYYGNSRAHSKLGQLMGIHGANSVIEMLEKSLHRSRDEGL